MKLNRSQIFLFTAILFLAITCLIYLQKVNSMGFYADDWYEIYGGEKFGSDRFFDIYQSDRPFRGVLSSTLYDVFGSQILSYQLLAIGIRWLGAIGLFWGLLLVWEDQFIPIGLITLIYLIYPGFLEQPHAFDYQAHQFAMSAMIWSIGLSIKTIKSTILWKRIIFYLGSAILALFCALLMEYYIGMEGYRFLILRFILLKELNGTLIGKLKKIVVPLSPFVISPLIFVIWRVFFFDSSRYTTDVGRLALDFLNSPLLAIVNIIRHFILDIGEVFIGAWIIPASQLLPKLTTTQYLIGFVITLVVIIIPLILIKLERKKDVQYVKQQHWAKEILILGFLGALICLIPINVSQKEVSFILLNRFSFPSSIGVSMTLIGAVYYFLSHRWKQIVLSVFIFSAVFTQYANNIRFANDWSETQQFWQQFSWRVPGLEEWTLLMGTFPADIQEGYTLWAPAGMFYFLNSEETSVSGQVLNDNTIKNLDVNLIDEKNHRSFYIINIYRKAIIFSKPTSLSCLRIFNGDHPEISVYDKSAVQFAAPFSNLEQILPEDQFNEQLFQKIIGLDEENNSWCYLYEKADLARQFDQWEDITQLFYKSEQYNLTPYDAIEWMPFIEAFAYLGDFDSAQNLVNKISEVPYYKESACNYYSNLPDSEDPSTLNGNRFLRDMFCKS